MATSRFEAYVRETLAEAVKPRRDELEKAVKDAEADIKEKVKALNRIAKKGIDALNAQLDRVATEKFGWKVDGEDPCPAVVLPNGTVNASRYAEADAEYNYALGRRAYKNGPAKKASAALFGFDGAVEKAATRLVVCKMDLHMKPEAFDKAMADAVAKLLGEAR